MEKLNFSFDFVKKHVGKFLLKRYLSDFVYGEIDQNQLALDISNGTAQIRDILLNVNVLNDRISKESLPFEFTEVHIDRIHIQILWKEGFSQLEITNLKVTLQPKERYEPATSMFESMWRSMTSSLHLAEDCIMEELNETPQSSEGLAMFAQTIDSIFSKIRVKFVDSIIRLQYAPVDSCVGIGIIFNIKEVTYRDEAGNDPSKEEITDPTQIKNKNYLEYSYRSRTILMNGVNISTVESTQTPSQRTPSTKTTRTPEVYDERNQIYDLRIKNGHIIDFARFTGIVEIILRMKRTEDLKGPKVSIEINLGPLVLFLCPRQLHLLIELIDGIKNPYSIDNHMVHYGGKPNTDLDQERMESDLQFLLAQQREISHGLQGGRWSTPLDDENTYVKPVVNDTFENRSVASVSMDSSISSSMMSSCTDCTNRTQSQRKPNKIDVDPTAEISHFEVHLPLLAIILLHEEILVVSDKSDYELVPSNVLQMQNITKKFFNNLNELCNITKLKSASLLLDTIVELSHLRLISTEINIEGDQKRTSSALSINGYLEANRFELNECLYVTNKQIENVSLISFDNVVNDGQISTQSSLKVTFKHVDNKTGLIVNKSPKTEFSLVLNKCTIEIDISIIDRINELFTLKQIIVHRNNSNRSPVAAAVVNITNQQNEKDDSIDIKALSSLLTIKLRFPKVDFRAPYEKDKIPWWLRCVHDDFLLITFGNLSFHTLFNLKDTIHNYSFLSRCINVYYYTCEDSEPVHIAKSGYDEKYSNSMQDVRCRLEITVNSDDINNTIPAVPSQLPSKHYESFSAGVNNLYDKRKRENGPFSAKKVVHESNTPHDNIRSEDPRELLLPGEKHEINNFMKETMNSSKIQIKIYLPTVSMQFTSKLHYELIYNRINNDLLLWEPSFNKFKQQQPQQQCYKYTKIDTGDGYEVFSLATSKIQDGSEDDSQDSDDDYDDPNVFYSTYDANSQTISSTNDNQQSSYLSLNLDIQQGVLCLWTLVRDNNTNNVIPGQHGEILINIEDAKLFLVNGYMGDMNLGFVCMEIYNAQLYHCDLMSSPNQIPPLKDIGTSPGEHLQSTLYKSDSGILSNSRGLGGSREMITLCVKIKANHETHHVKTVTLAAGINKTTLRHRMYNGSNDWLSQLLDFLNVQDYPVPGYQAKDIITEMHLHFWDASIDYRPLYLPLRTVITLANFSISSHLTIEANTTCLRFIAEDCYLFLSDKNIQQQKFKKPFYGPIDLRRDYICLIEIGVLEMCLKTTDNCVNHNQQPHIDMRISNNRIDVRCCADSCLALAKLIKYVANNGDLLPPDEQINSGSSSGYNSPKHQPEQLIKVDTQEISNISEVQQKQIIDKIKEAVDDELPTDQSKTIKTNRNKNNELYSYHGAKLFYFPGENQIVQDRVNPLPQVTSELGTTPFEPTILDSDEDFCFIDQETDCNILPKSGEPEVRWLTDKPVRIIDDYYSKIQKKPDPLITPKDFPCPIMRYTIVDMSISWHIYGGSDFDTNKDKKKRIIKNVNFTELKLTNSVSFSKFQRNEITFLHSHNNNLQKNKTNRNWLKQGGNNRNHDIRIILNLNKLSFSHDTYGDDKDKASRNVLLIHDLEIVDRLKTSEFNKLLHLWTTEARPRRTGRPMVMLKVIFTRPDPQLKRQECNVKINCEPLKFNIDQDALLFIIDFAKQLTGSASEELGSASPKHTHHLPVVTITDNTAMRTSNISEKSEKDENLLIFLDETTKTNIDSKQNVSSTSINTIDEDDSEIYFRVLYVPFAIPIRLDYKGKHINMDHGPLAGLLMGLAQLNGCEFSLKPLDYRLGLLGIQKLFSYMLQEWLSDIKKNQLPSLLSGVGPVQSFVTLICGIRDLFWLPIEQYKKDGRILRGLHRGANSFSTSTAMAALELTTRLIHLIQITAETAFDMLTPGPSVRMLPKTKSRRKRYGQPKDIREGVTNAVMLLREGIGETADNIVQVASHEHEQKGYSGAIGGVMRQVPSTVLRPLIFASEATTNLLGGMKHQLVPDARREADDKFRKDDNDDSNLL